MLYRHSPYCNLGLLERCYIGTPHIAGYSADGKANATRMSLEALSRHFGLGNVPEILPPPPPQRVLHATSRPEALLAIYNPHTDSCALKATPGSFEHLRGNYPLRREEQAYE